MIIIGTALDGTFTLDALRMKTHHVTPVVFLFRCPLTRLCKRNL